MYIKGNKAYTDNPENGVPLLATKWQPNGNHPAPQVRLGKVSIDTGGGEDAPQEIEEISEEKPSPKSKSKYSHAKTVFSWFPKPQKAWEINTTELQHAELLFVRGEAQVRAAMNIVQEYGDNQYCPSITRPSHLEQKWASLRKFAGKQGLL